MHWLRFNETISSIKGYSWVGINREVSPKAKRGSGGVGLLIRNDFVHNCHTLDHRSCERMMWVRLSGFSDKKDIFFVCFLWF